MAASKRVRIGVIGCGGRARGHLRALVGIPEADVAALTDINRDRIRWHKEKLPAVSAAEEFEDHREMLKSADLDAVVICTPHTLHYTHAMDALRAGVHALIEKPMVCTAGQAREVAAEAERRGLVALVGYQRRYHPNYRYMRQVIASGGLGEVQFVSAMQGQNWLGHVRGKWRTDPALGGGGQIMDSGSHLIDILLWTTGLAASEVFAFVEGFDVPVDVNTALSVRFENGAQGNISVVGNSPGKMREDLTVWGSKGAIFLRAGEGPSSARLQHMPFEGDLYEPPESEPRSNPTLNFVNAILGREPNESPAANSIRVMELTEAAWESAKTGRVVKVRRGP